MLTGDNERSAKAIALQVGVDEYYAQLLPDDKVNVVKKLKERYGSVAMVGDGVNDAPSMAVSNVGIAMGAAGTDVAIEAGDIVLMSDDLSKINYVRELSRKTVHNIKAKHCCFADKHRLHGCSCFAWLLRAGLRFIA